MRTYNRLRELVLGRVAPSLCLGGGSTIFFPSLHYVVLSAMFSLQVANMLRALAHGRAADAEFEIGATQAMYSTILVVLQVRSGVRAFSLGVSDPAYFFADAQYYCLE